MVISSFEHIGQPTAESWDWGSEEDKEEGETWNKLCAIYHINRTSFCYVKKKLYLSKASTSLFPITAYQEKCKEYELQLL